MAIPITTLKLAPALDGTKTMLADGTIAAFETINVEVGDIVEDGEVPDGTQIRFVSKRNGETLAKFPAVEEDVWEISDTTGICTLSLNTRTMQHLFHCLGVDDSVYVKVYLENRVTDTFAGVCEIPIGNWRQSPKDPVTGWSQLSDALATLYGRMNEHEHTGDDGTQKILHSSLIGAGEHTHDEIDGLFSAIADKVSTHDLFVEVDALENKDGAQDIVINSLVVGKQDAINPTWQNAINALATLPSVFTENQMRAKLNEVITILKGVYHVD